MSAQQQDFGPKGVLRGWVLPKAAFPSRQSNTSSPHEVSWISAKHRDKEGALGAFLKNGPFLQKPHGQRCFKVGVPWRCCARCAPGKMCTHCHSCGASPLGCSGRELRRAPSVADPFSCVSAAFPRAAGLCCSLLRSSSRAVNRSCIHRLSPPREAEAQQIPFPPLKRGGLGQVAAASWGNA